MKQRSEKSLILAVVIAGPLSPKDGLLRLRVSIEHHFNRVFYPPCFFFFGGGGELP